MDKMTIRTDHKWRNFKYGHELAPKWRKEHDWMSDEEYETASFVWYKGWATPLSEFMSVDKNAPFGGKWNGYTSDTFFSGVVIEVSDDGEQYRVGMYYS